LYFTCLSGRTPLNALLRWPTVDHIAGKPEIVFAAFKGYENEEIALNTGMIVREMLRHESLCKILLHSEQSVSPSSRRRTAHDPHDRFYMYPHYIETTTFGVSCDAYTNLKETLTKHKTIVAEFLDKNYDRVSSHRVSLWYRVC
jgi:calcium binding protein 39